MDEPVLDWRSCIDPESLCEEQPAPTAKEIGDFLSECATSDNKHALADLYSWLPDLLTQPSGDVVAIEIMNQCLEAYLS